MRTLFLVIAASSAIFFICSGYEIAQAAGTRTGQETAGSWIGQETSGVWIGQETGGTKTGQETELTQLTGTWAGSPMAVAPIQTKSTRQKLETVIWTWMQEDPDSWQKFATHCASQPILIRTQVADPKSRGNNIQGLRFSCSADGGVWQTKSYDNATLQDFFELNRWPSSPTGMALFDKEALYRTTPEHAVLPWDFVGGTLREMLRKDDADRSI